MTGPAMRGAGVRVRAGVDVQGKVRAASDSRRSRYEDVGGTGSGGSVSYMDVPPEALRDAIAGVAHEGDAIVLGRTSDSGAFSIRVLSDKQVYKWYPDSVDKLLDVLHTLSSFD